jgi:hypothetical protein
LDLSGPIAGFHHDAYLFTKSKVEEKFEVIFTQTNSVVYADSAYPALPGLFRSVKGKLSKPVRQVQDALCSARGEIEHFFAFLINNFRGLSNTLEMKTGLRHIGVLIRLCVFLANCLICAEGGNQTSQRFGCPPPTLRQYLDFCRSLLRARAN